MGGVGSGRPVRRQVVEDCLRLDAACLNKRNCFMKGSLRREQFTWSVDGEVVARAWIDVILFARERPRMVIRVDGMPSQTIRLTYTQPHLGGRRWCFVCPSGRRCRTLYLISRTSIFQCRQAAGLTYYSKQLNPADRVKHRARKLRKALPGADDDKYPPRPRGMHQRKYEEIVSRLRDLDAKAYSNWIAYLGAWAERNELRGSG